ncbi:transcriptional regulator GcvA [Mesorhizobium sp. CA8]|uniref:transcriptional regulator GcvA n=1 Tax=unclassified Mesorhizobium TaxID=325217 RepID=UPI001CCE8552|nr:MULTISPECIES: transcriptional regulator GcvA [unclassified Mesorhizobium]MBZ9765049.1 transcriptional regulator GcvA [Mesorhizobium sp. CA8]MBZ9823489.1 transcriptional regulator GcvA [Mesorhizobium sp. CA4]
MKRLPGLTTLYVFECAARHLNFSRAAAELNVTPAAVSNQIRQLEKEIGSTLFERNARSLKLTENGELLLVSAQDAFMLLRRATNWIGEAKRRTLSLTTSPSFATKWLVPRLGAFCLQHPEIELRLDVSDQNVPLSEKGPHLSVRFGAVPPDGLHAEQLFDEWISPVCAPSVLDANPELSDPQSLKTQHLIHVDWRGKNDAWPDWHSWLLAAGVHDVDVKRGLHVSQTYLALEAAIQGQGIVLGNSTLVGDDIKAGRLVHLYPHSLSLSSRFAYRLLTPPTILDRPVVRSFRTWLLDEVRAAKGAR